MINLFKSNLYLINGREGQYELTTEKDEYCFFMSDTCKYEYFVNPTVVYKKSLQKNDEK